MAPTVLITGSSGYIGSHFTKYFSKAGWKVVGLDLVPPPSALANYLETWKQTNISDQETVVDLCRNHHVDVVVHCAARCLVGESMKDPQGYHDNNFVRAKKLADAIIEAKVSRFIFSSTAAVYGEPQTTPIPEDHPKDPINPYGESKLAFENELMRRKQAGTLSVGIFRYFNAAGADPDAEIGEQHDPETHLIPNAVRAALGKGNAFEVYGTDYPTRDGTCERDYIHVWDLAEAHLLLAQRMMKEGPGGIFNLGTSQGFTINEVLSEIDRQVDQKIPRLLKMRRAGDPSVLIANATQAQQELIWKPAYSDLPTIISTALKWHQK